MPVFRYIRHLVFGYALQHLGIPMPFDEEAIYDQAYRLNKSKFGFQIHIFILFSDAICRICCAAVFGQVETLEDGSLGAH